MRVFVAGASGALGSSLLSALSQAGHEPLTSELNPAQRGGFLASLHSLHADAVINILGTGTELAAGYREQALVNRSRIEGTSTLLAAAKLLGATRYVGTTSFYGYGFDNFGDIPLTEAASFGETDATRNDPVHRALLATEQQVRAFGGSILRLGHLFAEEARVVPPVSRSWTGSLPVVHVDDAAPAFVSALESAPPRAVYNIAADEPTTWRALQQAQSRRDGFTAPIALDNAVLRLIAPFASQIICGTSMRLSTAAAARDLGFTARYSSVESAFVR